jgi:hypothetical protein
VKRHWSKWFDVVRLEEATDKGGHDFVVLAHRE